MTTNVFTMSGTELVTAKSLLESVANRDDVKHVVIAMCRDDDFIEIMYDRQSITDIVMASAALGVVASDLARQTIEES